MIVPDVPLKLVTLPETADPGPVTLPEPAGVAHWLSPRRKVVPDGVPVAPVMAVKQLKAAAVHAVPPLLTGTAPERLAAVRLVRLAPEIAGKAPVRLAAVRLVRAAPEIAGSEPTKFAAVNEVRLVPLPLAGVPRAVFGSVRIVPFQVNPGTPPNDPALLY